MTTVVGHIQKETQEKKYIISVLLVRDFMNFQAFWCFYKHWMIMYPKVDTVDYYYVLFSSRCLYQNCFVKFEEQKIG